MTHVQGLLNVMDTPPSQGHNQMEQYAEVIGSGASKEDYLRIAAHFQKAGSHFKAGQFFLKGQEYAKVLGLLQNR